MRLWVLLAFLVGTVPLGAAPITTGKDRFVTLDLQAMPAPTPALKYMLLPEVREMQPGNCIPLYLKCFCEQNNFFYHKDVVAERERLIACPLTDIKKGSLKGYGGSATRGADHAARMELCDWNLLPKIREEGFGLLLPDLQQLRMLAAAVQVRCRGEIVDGDFDGAIRSLKTLFALSRHTGEHPTLIGSLVGVAISHIALNLLEEMIQQPNAPNMYWALSSMPTPFFDLRKSLGGERMLFDSILGPLGDPKRTWDADDIVEAKKRATELYNALSFPADRNEEANAWLRERLKDDEWLQASRKFLVEHEYPAAKVKNYPPEQVLAYRLLVKSRIHHDEIYKWMLLPYWQAADGLNSALAKKPVTIEDLLCQNFVIAGGKVRQASLRTDQRLALYRVIEAVRLHGAANQAKLPTKLDDIAVPLPVDPVTNKPFKYKVDGLTATLEGETIKLAESTYQYRHELRLRK